jgi:hypothetical protein
MRLIRWVLAKVKTSHSGETAMLNVASRTVVTYQMTKTPLCGVFGLKPLNVMSETALGRWKFQTHKNVPI